MCDKTPVIKVCDSECHFDKVALPTTAFPPLNGTQEFDMTALVVQDF